MGFRKQPLSLVPKLVKFFCTTTRAATPNISRSDRLHTCRFVRPSPECDVTSKRNSYCELGNSRFSYTVCVKDENGCFDDRIVRKAQVAIQQYNERHNFKFVLSRVIRAVDFFGTTSTIYIEVKDGPTPHLYKVQVSGVDAGDELNGTFDPNAYLPRGMYLISWRTLDRAEFDDIYT